MQKFEILSLYCLKYILPIDIFIRCDLDEIDKYVAKILYDELMTMVVFRILYILILIEYNAQSAFLDSILQLMLESNCKATKLDNWIKQTQERKKLTLHCEVSKTIKAKQKLCSRGTQ